MFNISFQARGAIFTAVRRLEFALFRITQQLDELVYSVQTAMLGSVPTSLVSPSVLLNNLKNMTLQLPSGYELRAGIGNENVFLYYKLVKFSVLTDPRVIKLILTVPLKTLVQHLSLYQIVTLPELTQLNRHIQYITSFKYLGVHANMRDYILLSENQYSRGIKSNIVLCQETVVIMNAQTPSCEGSLYFQNEDSRQLCKRQLLPESPAPTLQFHQSFWSYFYPERRRVTVHCPAPEGSKVHSVTLEGAGTLHDVTGCYVTSAELRTVLTVSGSVLARLEPPQFYLPEKLSTIMNDEQPRLEKIFPVNTQHLDEVTAPISQHRRTFNVDSLLYLQEAATQRTTVPEWLLILPTSSGLIAIIGAIGFASYMIYFKIRHPLEAATKKSKVAAQDTDPAITNVLQRDQEDNRTNSSENVTFAAYFLLSPRHIAQHP
jgi:hypothetical protein